MDDATGMDMARLLVMLDRERRLHRKFSIQASHLGRDLAAASEEPAPEGFVSRIARLCGISAKAPRRSPRKKPAVAGGCSIVIPTWRDNAFVRKAVASCLAQTAGADGLQILLCVNGGDTEYFERLRGEYGGDARIEVLRTGRADPNAARRLGVEAAKMPFLAFVDDDDEITPGFVERLRGFFADPNTNIAIGALRECGGDDGQPQSPGGSRLSRPDGVIADTLRSAGSGATQDRRELSPVLSSFCYRLFRTAFFKRAFRISDSALPFAEDVVFWVENFAAIEGPVRCDSPDAPEFYIRRMTGDSRSRPASSRGAAAGIRPHLECLETLSRFALDAGRTIEERCFAVSKIEARAGMISKLVASLDGAAKTAALDAIRASGNPFTFLCTEASDSRPASVRNDTYHK